MRCDSEHSPAKSVTKFPSKDADKNMVHYTLQCLPHEASRETLSPLSVSTSISDGLVSILQIPRFILSSGASSHWLRSLELT